MMDIFNQLHMTKVGDLTELSCGWGIIRIVCFDPSTDRKLTFMGHSFEEFV